MDDSGERTARWLAALEERHLARLEFAEVRRALQALSAIYVAKRSRLGAGGALDGAGKRAAFALFFAPLHFLTVGGIVRALGAALPPPREIADLGCGTGSASAAWALECARLPVISGIDRNAWAVEEARRDWRLLGIDGAARVGDLDRARWEADAILVAYTANELSDERRERLYLRLERAAEGGARILVVEPIARGAAPWWDEWSDRFRAAGGRADEWRFPADLPPLLSRLDRAAGLDHRELTARTLWRPGGAARGRYTGDRSRPEQPKRVHPRAGRARRT